MVRPSAAPIYTLNKTHFFGTAFRPSTTDPIRLGSPINIIWHVRKAITTIRDITTRHDADARNRELGPFLRITVLSQYSNNSGGAWKSHARHPDRHLTRNKSRITAKLHPPDPREQLKSTRNQTTDIVYQTAVSHRRLGHRAAWCPDDSHDHTQRRGNQAREESSPRPTPIRPSHPARSPSIPSRCARGLTVTGLPLPC